MCPPCTPVFWLKIYILKNLRLIYFAQGKNHYIMYNRMDFLLNIHVVYLFDGLQFQHSHFYKREIGIA